MAGEFFCFLRDDMIEEERRGRMYLLMIIVYYAKVFEWFACFNFFVIFLLEIERGDRGWDNKEEFFRVEVNIFYRYFLAKREVLVFKGLSVA